MPSSFNRCSAVPDPESSREIASSFELVFIFYPLLIQSMLFLGRRFSRSPSTPKGSINLDHGFKFRQLRPCQRDLRCEIPCIAVQNLEVACSASFVSHVGQSRCFFRCLR